MDTLELLVAYIEREDARLDHAFVVRDGLGNARWESAVLLTNAYCKSLTAAGGRYY